MADIYQRTGRRLPLQPPRHSDRRAHQAARREVGREGCTGCCCNGRWSGCCGSRRGCRGADRVHRGSRRRRREQDPGHQGGSRDHRPRSQRGEGPRRSRSQAPQGGCEQGRCRGLQEEARRKPARPSSSSNCPSLPGRPTAPIALWAHSGDFGSGFPTSLHASSGFPAGSLMETALHGPRAGAVSREFFRVCCK